MKTLLTNKRRVLSYLSYVPEPLGPMTALKGFSGPIIIRSRYDLKFSISICFKRGGIFMLIETLRHNYELILISIY